jgi:hypothetical protein
LKTRENERAMRRSLHTDIEHSVAFVDAASASAIEKYRCE